VAGSHVVHAAADAGYEVRESDETNNVGERAARVVERAPEGADLALVSPKLAPDELTELPQEIVVHALVENRGRAAVESTVAVFEWSTWARPGPSPSDRSALDLWLRSP
jgi:nucleoside-diphosphate-sugar epimerase